MPGVTVFTVASVVTLPTLDTSPLKLALVVTVLAFPVTFPVRFAVIMPAAKSPLASRFTIVLGVLSVVAALADNYAVLIFAAVDPPTVNTVGKSAVPPKSPASFTFPFNSVVASGVAVVIAAST